jgi:hypothetical protein
VAGQVEALDSAMTSGAPFRRRLAATFCGPLTTAEVVNGPKFSANPR